MGILTLNQARGHLQGVRRLAVDENKYLSCVREYLSKVEVDILGSVRGDHLTDHNVVRDLVRDIQNTEKLVKVFLTEV